MTWLYRQKEEYPLGSTVYVHGGKNQYYRNLKVELHSPFSQHFSLRKNVFVLTRMCAGGGCAESCTTPNQDACTIKWKNEIFFWNQININTFSSHVEVGPKAFICLWKKIKESCEVVFRVDIEIYVRAIVASDLLEKTCLHLASDMEVADLECLKSIILLYKFISLYY